jgi:hypothetical protein
MFSALRSALSALNDQHARLAAVVIWRLQG